MIFISHRGNISGSNKNLENKQDYIFNALQKGYDVEIDIWADNNGDIFLGHDGPETKCDINFIMQRGLWIHCKNIESLQYCKDNNVDNNYFFHNIDDATLTSKNIFWTYPGKKITKYSIAVMPEIHNFDNIENSYGICSDNICYYKLKYG